MEITSALQSIELFNGLTTEQIKALIGVGKLQIFHKGDVILKQGEQSTEIHIVLEGMVEVVSDLSEHASSLVILGAGQSFGEMALLDAGPRSASIRCLSPEAKIFTFTRKALLSFWEQQCEVGYRMMTNIARDVAFKLRVRNLTCVTQEEAMR